MYLIELRKVTNIKVVDKLYEELKKYGVMRNIYITQHIDNLTDNLYKYKAHFVKLTLSDFHIEEDTLIDILMEISHNNKNILIDNSGCSFEDNQSFTKICEKLSVNYRIVGKGALEKIDLKNPSVLDIVTIKEILNHKDFFEAEDELYSVNDFILEFKLDNEGEIYNNIGKRVGNVFRSNILNILMKTEKESLKYILDINKKMLQKEKETGLTMKLAEPWYFLGNTLKGNLDNNTSVVDGILEYKYRVFELIKNLGFDMHNNIDDRIKQILRETRYMPLDEIIKIENKNKDIYTKDWFLEILAEN